MILTRVDQLSEYSTSFSPIYSKHVHKTDSNLVLNRLKNNLNGQLGKFYFGFQEHVQNYSGQ